MSGCTPASPENTNNPATIEQRRAPEEAPDTHRLHPEFNLTPANIQELVGNQPPAIQRRILSQPAVFLEYVARLLPREAPILALVDKQTPLPADYVPDDLVALEQYADQLTLNREGLALRAMIMPDVLAMVEAAKQDGVQLDISSTYRSYDYQKSLFEYWTEELGLAEAERVSARPGTSQHQLGTTIDFGSVTPAFAEHPAGVWLLEHASKFGFSLSYPDGYEAVTGYSYEPWHFRWISRSGTRMEARYFDGIQHHFLEFWADAESVLRDACTGGSCRDTVRP